MRWSLNILSGPDFINGSKRCANGWKTAAQGGVSSNAVVPIDISTKLW